MLCAQKGKARARARLSFLPAAEQAGQGVMHLFFFFSFLFNKFLIWGNNNHILDIYWLSFPEFEFPGF